jgi:Amt family ammonium transporter
MMLSSALVLLGSAGFVLLATGLSRAHASATQCLIGLGVFAVSAIAFHTVGHFFMYGHLESEFFALAVVIFAASIIPGALTERVHIWPLFIFTLFFSAFLFPVAGSFTWGGTWLKDLGFHDFAGSTVIHVAAGCAALTGSYIMGPRAGRYAPDGRPIPFPGSNIPLAMTGTFLVLAGSMGLAAGHTVHEMSQAYTNLIMGAAGGVVAALMYVTWNHNKPDTTIVMNALVAGLVAVSAGADLYSPFFSILIGAVGGVLCAFIIPRMDRYKFDDPAGIIPAHLAAGIWGTLAVVFAGHFIGQIAGLLLTILITGGGSAIVWLFLKRVMGLRCSGRAERHGLDMEAVGLEAYPDFPVRTTGRPDITQIDKF